MSLSLNGYPEYNGWVLENIPMFKKYTDIRNPDPAECLVFIDEHECTLVDSLFGLPTDASDAIQKPSAREWWSQPSDRHSRGVNLSFADGHVEHWRQDAPRVFTGTTIGQTQTVLPEEMRDWLRFKPVLKQR